MSDTTTTGKTGTSPRAEVADATADATAERSTPSVPTRTPDRLDLPIVATWDNAELERAMRRGKAPELDSLVGWEFHGYNTPAIAGLLGIRKFVKGFFRASDGSTRGYNVVIKQNGGPLEPWVSVRLFGRPIRHGYYEVRPVDPYARDGLHPNGLLLDYGAGGNFFLNPSKTLRDYLVQIDPDDPDLLLGKACVALGPLRPEVGYFILQRGHRAEG